MQTYFYTLKTKWHFFYQTYDITEIPQSYILSPGNLRETMNGWLLFRASTPACKLWLLLLTTKQKKL